MQSRALRPGAVARDTVRWTGSVSRHVVDEVASEEPLEIRLGGVTVTVTMRTPGDDLDLAAGFLFTEGIIRGPRDIASLAYCATDDPEAVGNAVNLNPTDPLLVDPPAWERHGPAVSSCGVCGKLSIAALRRETPEVTSSLRVPARTLYALPARLRAAQETFGRTGGLHAAALFAEDGTLLCLREDIGRHNAVDKVIGHVVREHTAADDDHPPRLDRHMLLVSGRISFEIVQKALAAGIPILAAVSAPSSLAVDLAGEMGMTLVGFLRVDGEQPRCNVYTAAERIVADRQDADAALTGSVRREGADHLSGGR